MGVGGRDPNEPVVTRDEDGPITNQHYLVLFVAYLGWLMDMMDATLYTIVQTPALEDLLGTTDKSRVSFIGGVILACFLVGAAIGGIVFGVLADHYGRARMMMVTVLVYSVATGLCAIVQTWWQLLILRVITGVGTGGEWACGASLVAEVWPDRYRTTVSPLLHSGAGAGFLLAAIVYYVMSPYGWRYVFLVGLFPALLGVAMRFFVDESKMWEEAQKKKAEAGVDHPPLGTTLKLIFSKRHRQDTVSVSIFMFILNFQYWSTAAWIPSVIRDLNRDFPERAWDEDDATTLGVVLLNVGAIAGALSWIWTADRFGRKPIFAYFVAGQMIILSLVFGLVRHMTTVILLMPFCGFVLSGVYGGMPLYLPELYPTAIRGTGAALVYNIGRFFAGLGPLIMGGLVGVTGNYYESVAIMPIFSIVGLISLLFPRETRGLKLE